jgi:hypothetical protein
MQAITERKRRQALSFSDPFHLAIHGHLVGSFLNGDDARRPDKGNDEKHPDCKIVEKHPMLRWAKQPNAKPEGCSE